MMPVMSRVVISTRLNNVKGSVYLAVTPISVRLVAQAQYMLREIIIRHVVRLEKWRDYFLRKHL